MTSSFPMVNAMKTALKMLLPSRLNKSRLPQTVGVVDEREGRGLWVLGWGPSVLCVCTVTSTTGSWSLIGTTKIKILLPAHSQQCLWTAANSSKVSNSNILHILVLRWCYTWIRCLLAWLRKNSNCNAGVFTEGKMLALVEGHKTVFQKMWFLATVLPISWVILNMLLQLNGFSFQEWELFLSPSLHLLINVYKALGDSWTFFFLTFFFIAHLHPAGSQSTLWASHILFCIRWRDSTIKTPITNSNKK